MTDEPKMATDLSLSLSLSRWVRKMATINETSLGPPFAGAEAFRVAGRSRRPSRPTDDRS